MFFVVHGTIKVKERGDPVSKGCVGAKERG
jgi:lipoprotein-anchoring transpeptidase ErfK/SrfK